MPEYRSQIKNATSEKTITIGTKRGRPLQLPDELDTKLRKFLVNLRDAGGNVNRTVVYGVLMGLIQSDLERYGRFLDFNVTNGWIRYLYNRMKFTRRMVTTSRRKINREAWVEVIFVRYHASCEETQHSRRAYY